MHYPLLRYLFLFTALSTALSACSVGYISRAAWEQAKILKRRVPLQEVLAQPDLSQERREKLELVLALRAFATTIGLTPDGNYTSYSYSDREPLVWLVMASRRDAFELYHWWFPVVGSVPYKGFFEREDAATQAQQLETQGYETWVRGAAAFSTLGWFNDPLLASMLKYSPVDLANTILHEITHASVWIKGSVPFNETLANFVGHQAAIEYFRGQAASSTDAEFSERARSRLALAEQQLATELLLAGALQNLVTELTQLYSAKESIEFKLQERQSIFMKHSSGVRAAAPELRSLNTLNNAEIMQLHIYRNQFELFARCFERQGAKLPNFMQRMRTLAQVVEAEDKDPYKELERCASE